MKMIVFYSAKGASSDEVAMTRQLLWLSTSWLSNLTIVAEQPQQSLLPLGSGIKATMSSSLLDDHHRHFFDISTFESSSSSSISEFNPPTCTPSMYIFR